MPITLNEQQANTVEAGRKKVKPEYYDAEARKTKEIDNDLEAALILIPAEAKAEAVARIEKQEAPVRRILQRNAILKQALEVDIENANTVINALRVTEDLETFRQKFLVFRDVTGLSNIIDATQLAIEETVMLNDRAKHDLVIATLIEKQVANGVTDELDKERKSWAAVIKQYP